MSVDIEAASEERPHNVHGGCEFGARWHIASALKSSACKLDDLAEQGVGEGNPRNQHAELRPQNEPSDDRRHYQKHDEASGVDDQSIGPRRRERLAIAA